MAFSTAAMQKALYRVIGTPAQHAAACPIEYRGEID
jgi:hypothetical protein